MNRSFTVHSRTIKMIIVPVHSNSSTKIGQTECLRSARLTWCDTNFYDSIIELTDPNCYLQVALVVNVASK